MNPARWLKGKTIERAEMRPYDDGRGGKAHKPIIHFNDGSAISFRVRETESLDYGVEIDCHESQAPRPVTTLTEREWDVIRGCIGFVHAGEVDGGPLADQNPRKEKAKIAAFESAMRKLGMQP